MTRFAYISDTHWGVEQMGYCQQPGYPAKLPAIWQALQQVCVERDVDFVIHGGDMTDRAETAVMQGATGIFGRGLPLHLCLGNHDLTTPDALGRWLGEAGGFFPGGKPEYTIKGDDCLIHVAPTQWGEEPYYWDRQQQAHFKPHQLDFLADALSQDTYLPHILVTHAPVYGLPPQQTGRDEPYHETGGEFAAQIEGLAARHPNLKCVLGAHNHMNMCIKRNGVWFVTVSALVETPFECKVVTAGKGRLTMETLALQPRLGFTGDYNADHAYVQGRPEDRAFDESS